MPSIVITPYTIASVSIPALWRLRHLWDGREVRREIVDTSTAQRRLDASRAERARLENANASVSA